MGNPMKDLASVVKPVRSISPAALSATATGEWVDTKGFGSVMLVLSLGAMTTVDADTNYFTPSIEDADESAQGDAAVLAAANYEAVLGGSFIAKVNASGLANTFRTARVLNCKRYVRIILTETGTSAIGAAAMVLLGDPDVAPVS